MSKQALQEETPEEQDKRIDDMLNCMVVEAALFALHHEEAPPYFTQKQIADFVGCGRRTIQRIEESALSKVKKHLLK